MRDIKIVVLTVCNELLLTFSLPQVRLLIAEQELASLAKIGR